MSRFVKTLPYLLGIVIGLLLWSVTELIFTSLQNTDVKIVVAIIVAFGSLTTAVLVAIYTHASTKQREIIAQKRMSERELIVQKKISERELIVQEKISERESDLQKHIREREIEEAHRQKKVEIYIDFIKLVSSFLQAENENNKRQSTNQQEVLDELEKFHNGTLLWGGPKVIRAYLDYRKNSSEGEDTLIIFKYVDALFKALREDIGLSNQGIDKLELVQLYLSEPKEIDILLLET